MITDWRCELCGAAGALKHAKNEPAFSMAYAVLREHRKHGAKECAWDPMKIRVQIRAKSTAKEQRDE